MKSSSTLASLRAFNFSTCHQHTRPGWMERWLTLTIRSGANNSAARCPILTESRRPRRPSLAYHMQCVRSQILSTEKASCIYVRGMKSSDAHRLVLHGPMPPLLCALCRLLFTIHRATLRLDCLTLKLCVSASADGATRYRLGHYHGGWVCERALPRSVFTTRTNSRRGPTPSVKLIPRAKYASKIYSEVYNCNETITVGSLSQWVAFSVQSVFATLTTGSLSSCVEQI